MQVGYVGLLKAINNFDPAVGSSLAAYAQPCISGEIKRHFRDKRWQVHVKRPRRTAARTAASARRAHPAAGQIAAVGRARCRARRRRRGAAGRRARRHGFPGMLSGRAADRRPGGREPRRPFGLRGPAAGARAGHAGRVDALGRPAGPPAAAADYAVLREQITGVEVEFLGGRLGVSEDPERQPASLQHGDDHGLAAVLRRKPKLRHGHRQVWGCPGRQFRFIVCWVHSSVRVA
jgi:Sigma-70 region 2